MKNTLYFGDNLPVLRDYVDNESVDLIYLDPPFNSNADYNVLFAEQDGSQSAAQIQAFQDTWHWDQAAVAAYTEVVDAADDLSLALQGFHTVLGGNDMLAYLSMMAIRLKELYRVLKPTGSIYLHCDPTASHYLKVVMDSVFGPKSLANEIIWKRTYAHGGAKRFGPVHDSILFYRKGEEFVWNPQFVDYSEDYIRSFFRFSEPDGRRYRLTILTGSGIRHGSSGKPWKGIDPTAIGRHWAIPGYVRKALPNPKAKTVQEALDQLEESGRVAWPKKPGGSPSFKQYLDDMKGATLQDTWVDIPPLSAQARERLGYPTQKPEALLGRIIGASSNEGDVVLDPFCGCGTAVAAAQKLNRQWIGIDITYLAISLIKIRLQDAFGDTITSTYDEVGEPADLEGAKALAETNPYQFQWWALDLVRAKPAKDKQKKGADKGIDGRIIFHDEGEGEKAKQIVLSVKAGKLHAAFVRDLVGVVNREKAAIGVLLSMDQPTMPMRAEAAEAGFYESPWDNHKYPRIQLLTIEQLLAGDTIKAPQTKDVRTFKKAPKHKKQATHKQKNILEGD